MFTHKAALATCGALLGLFVSVSAMAGISSQRTYLTFSGPVRLPGVTLAAGTYVFETPEPGLNLVRVLDRNRSQVYFMAFTERTPKPSGMPADHQIAFQESSAKVAPAIDAWYPWDTSTGHRFIYRHTR